MTIRRILVIRLGALGDFIQSFPAFSAVRRHHPEAEITLLTTAPFVSLARLSPWFDRVLTDDRPRWSDLRGLLDLRRRLRGYDRIYDLQTSSRSSRYFFLAGQKNWSGIAPGCLLPHASPVRDLMHTRARQRDQLRMAGIAEVPEADLSWLAGEAEHEAGLPPRAVLIPGAAPHRPEKRWPADRFGELAVWLAGRGMQPVIAGTAADTPLAKRIRTLCPQARDLTGRTSLPDLAALLSGASLAVGNDTGPMHLAAAMGCPSLVLFSAGSDPALTAPLGRAPGQVEVLRVADLTTLPVERVAGTLSRRH
ncbi:glycosyltransferase family 9 protein [Acetobacter sp. AN02]|uniref:glycosyltransferase family 9 protein n=1 Tax=Acetobacter sp. AN02 TaxID=2894186 RepID=UPI00243413A2|nr:glycosyltransferase family 9 protein [Acetobacter sp. AN02]MDG6094128.1 glycosyltransferase family 9 protein [Acetobacter sp. AN02]